MLLLYRLLLAMRRMYRIQMKLPLSSSKPPNPILNNGLNKQKGSYNVFIVGISCKKMMQELNKKDGDRINVSISPKAYDALVTYTRQLNEKNNDLQQKPFTIEEVLDEEIIFLFSDE
jgi:hypothetical protein